MHSNKMSKLQIESRIFTPPVFAEIANPVPSDVLYEDPKESINYIATRMTLRKYGEPRIAAVDRTKVVVSIHGACKGNGTSAAEAVSYCFEHCYLLVAASLGLEPNINLQLL